MDDRNCDTIIPKTEPESGIMESTGPFDDKLKTSSPKGSSMESSEIDLKTVVVKQEPNEMSEKEFSHANEQNSDSDDSDSSSSEVDSSGSESRDPIFSTYRDQDPEEDSDATESILNITNDSISESINGSKKKDKNQVQLPPIEDLKITVEKEKVASFGKVLHNVDCMVVIQGDPNLPPVNLETVLFLEEGNTVLGQIFEVFGKTTEPFYCVRFNSAHEIAQKNIIPGAPVYYAPKTEHTHGVDMLKLAGELRSDASWKNDVEVPQRFQDYSDDEEESKAKRLFRKSRLTINGNTASTSSHQDSRRTMKPSRNFPTRSHIPSFGGPPTFPPRVPTPNAIGSYNQMNIRPANFNMPPPQSTGTTNNFQPQYVPGHSPFNVPPPSSLPPPIPNSWESLQQFPPQWQSPRQFSPQSTSQWSNMFGHPPPNLNPTQYSRPPPNQNSTQFPMPPPNQWNSSDRGSSPYSFPPP